MKFKLNNHKIYTSEYCEIKYIETLDVIYCIWKKYCEHKNYRSPLKLGLDFLKKRNVKNWIIDTRNGFKNCKEDSKWLIEKFIPSTIDSSCKKIIYILEENSELKLEILEQKNVLLNYFEVEIVSNEKKAFELLNI